jgi:hypothetical protein
MLVSYLRDGNAIRRVESENITSKSNTVLSKTVRGVDIALSMSERMAEYSYGVYFNSMRKASR